MSDVLSFNPNRALTANIGAAAAAKAYFYDAGTANLKTVYADVGLTTAHPSPLLADSAGVFAAVFTDGTPTKVVVQTSGGSTLYTLDPADTVSVGGLTNFDTVAELLADTRLTYGAGYYMVAAGNNLTAEGFRYEVAASGASDQHVTTAGGVKLYVLPGENGYNVKAFGATGDGVTNDTTAIQKAIDAAIASNGTAFVPKGVYSSQTLYIAGTGGMTFAGAGMYEARLVNRNTNGNHFISVAASNVEIYGLEVDGSYATNPPGVGNAISCGNWPNPYENIYVHHCLIRSNGFDAFGASIVSKSRITDCVVYNLSDTGIDLVEGCTDWVVANNTIISTGRFGIASETALIVHGECRRISIIGNTIIVKPGADVRYGIQLGTYTYGYTVSGNNIILETSGVQGIRTYSATCKRHTIVGNSIAGKTGFASREGIHIEDTVGGGTVEIAVIGNTIEGVEIGLRCYIISGVTLTGNIVNATDALVYTTDAYTVFTTVAANSFIGAVKFEGYTASSVARFANNIGSFTIVNNAGWTLQWIGARNTVTYNDGAINYLDPIAKGGVTASRPASPQVGDMYFDTTITRPIWWTGAAWIRADGVSV